jgi:Trk K+ transport system NAD-binding subunit
LWKEACTTAKEEANVKAVELKTMTRYYGEVTHNLFETRKNMRSDVLLSPIEKGEANRYLKAEREARMWKEQCAKDNRLIQETVSELQTVKQLLDSATIVVKKV